MTDIPGLLVGVRSCGVLVGALLIIKSLSLFGFRLKRLLSFPLRLFSWVGLVDELEFELDVMGAK